MGKDGVKPLYIVNEKGPVLGMTPDMKVLTIDGCKFKDMEKNGQLAPYADWRLPAKERARDLAKRMSIRELAGLMMYSSHQSVPGEGMLPGKQSFPTYGGKLYKDSGAEAWERSDQQEAFLRDDCGRHILVAMTRSGEDCARWNNEIQAFAESLPHAVPVNISTDPRHSARMTTAEFSIGGGDTSKWPEGLAMAACFDPAVAEEYGRTAAAEYRAMGICTALSPQVDMGTEPRWFRISGTFGSHPGLVTDYARAYCDGLQTTDGSADGWGSESVLAMSKHWPGGGTGEGGRDAHYRFGQFAVYPGDRRDIHLVPFTEGAFKLNGPTGQTASIMPYYTVSWDYDQKDHQNVGNSYSHYLIHDLLREKYGFDGIVCSDWDITGDPAPMDAFGSRSYGVENLTVAERHFRILENDVDQFGGNDDIKPILEAFEIGVKKYGEVYMRERFEASAVRLLTAMIRCGLFENPYLDPVKSGEIVGCEDFCRAGIKAQEKSVVMLKNEKRALPAAAASGRKSKVFIPDRHLDERMNFARFMIPAIDLPGAESSLVSRYYEPVNTPEEADFAICFIASPMSEAYSSKDVKDGGNGYLPISLKYGPYTADSARETSAAGGDPLENFTNRSYKGKTAVVYNRSDMELVQKTRKAMGEKPLIVVVDMMNPCILSEIEPYADALLVDFGVQQQVIFELISGAYEPSGLLPVQLPADMETVETHCEDVPFDMVPYTDTVGNTYDFGFGLNYSGVIRDRRNEKYHV